MTRQRFVLAMMVVVGCAPPKPPDLITRELPTGPIEPIETTHGANLPDAGGGFLDAGCCVAPFALRSEAGEVSATLVFPAESFDMDLDDAGVWRTTACVEPRADVFYFLVGFPTDDDAGVLQVDRVNAALPTSDTSNVAPAVNVFEGTDGGVCQPMDYSLLPDAG